MSSYIITSKNIIVWDIREKRIDIFMLHIELSIKCGNCGIKSLIYVHMREMI